MRDLGSAAKAAHLRDVARRIRRNAELVADERIRQQLLDIAGQYDRLAQALET